MKDKELRKVVSRLQEKLDGDDGLEMEITRVGAKRTSDFFEIKNLEQETFDLAQTLDALLDWLDVEVVRQEAKTAIVDKGDEDENSA